jgi:hypothetical protein
MDPWLRSDHVPDWLGSQYDGSQPPGCIVAIAHRGGIVAEHALGHGGINLKTEKQITAGMQRRYSADKRR